MAPGKRLNQYEIVAPIGAGGMGEVYRAIDTRLGREVAVKVLHRRFADDAPSRHRLAREARLVAQLSHPNIAAIHGLEEADGVLFLVLELVEGAPLADRLADGPLPMREALEIAAQVAAAVGEAHRHDILHRDLKPGNIMVDADGRVRVLDFGLAKCTDPGGSCYQTLMAAADLVEQRNQPVSPEAPTYEFQIGELDPTLPAPDPVSESQIEGTPVYMSPEQVAGETLDRRTDVWAIGCVLFEMITGRRPFEGDSIVETFDRIVAQEPDWTLLPESTPESVEVLLRQMLEKNPSRRIGDLGDARMLLERATQLMSGTYIARQASRGNRAAMGLGAALLVAVTALVGAEVGRSAPGSDVPGFDSVAVLPFENLTGEEGRDYFADGMTEELTTELGRIEALKVVSRSSVRAFDDRNVALPEMARQLGVRALVEASLLRDDDVRLSVRLYDAVEDVQIWGETYEAAAGEIESLHARVAQAIAAKLGIELTAAERSLLATTRPVDPEASAAYLDGRYWAAAGRGTTSIESFRRAVEIDPGYAAAWAALANAYVYRLPSDENMPLARHAAQTALNLDDSLGEAHAALAQVRFFFDWDWYGAETAFQRALMLAPSSATIRQRYASFLWARGRLDEAREQLQRAAELDPMSLFIRLEQGRTDYFARDYDAAVAAYEALLDRDRDFWWAHMFLGIAHQQAGDLGISAAELVTALGMIRTELGDQLQAGHDRAGYDGLMRAWIEAGKSNPRVQPTSLAAQHAFVGDVDEAFRWLEIAFEQRTRAMVWIGVDPQYDPLRDDPRFATLLARMGLASGN